MKTLFLAMAAMVLVACAMTEPVAYDPVEQFTQGYEIGLGRPRAQWTPAQKAQYTQDLLKFYQEKMAQNNASYASSASLYRPSVVSRARVSPQTGLATSQVQPDGRGGYTVWNDDGTTSSVRPNGRGGYDAWNSNGSTSTMEKPNSRGEVTSWNSNGTTSTASRSGRGYVIYNSDGTISYAQPDGHGGWTISR